MEDGARDKHPCKCMWTWRPRQAENRAHRCRRGRRNPHGTGTKQPDIGPCTNHEHGGWQGARQPGSRPPMHYPCPLHVPRLAWPCPNCNLALRSPPFPYPPRSMASLRRLACMHALRASSPHTLSPSSVVLAYLPTPPVDPGCFPRAARGPLPLPIMVMTSGQHPAGLRWWVGVRRHATCHETADAPESQSACRDKLSHLCHP
jgi:hypothetical protein